MVSGLWFGLWFGLGEVGRCREGGFARAWPDRRRAPAHGGLSPMRFRLAEDASTFGRSSGPVEQICVQCAQGKVMKAGRDETVRFFALSDIAQRSRSGAP